MEPEERRVRFWVLVVVVILTVGSAAAFLTLPMPESGTTGPEPHDDVSGPVGGGPLSGEPAPRSARDMVPPESREGNTLETEGKPPTPGGPAPCVARADLEAGIIRVELSGGAGTERVPDNPASPARLSLAGWHLYVVSARRWFTFPEGTALEAGTTLLGRTASDGEAVGETGILMIDTSALEVCRSYASASPYVARVFLWPDLALASRHLETVQLYDPDWNLVSSLTCP